MKATTPRRKKTAKRQLGWVDQKMFQTADRHAKAALYLTATGMACNVAEETDVLDQMTKASRFYNAKDNKTVTGDMVNACWEAGIAFGLAFGLRLRGVR